MDRTVRTVLTASIAGFVGPIQKAAQTAIAAGKSIAGAARDSSKEWDAVGSGALKVGAVVAAGLGFATKAAMDWESQFAGVRKTVSGSPAELDALEGSLRGMARTMAASHEEIAAVAEAAGQLGVATPAIAGFTKTMIMLGETTNLTSDEAATSLAQMMNVMQTAPSKVGNLASTLVALGNAGASTEADILGLGQRIASAGRQIGLSEDQVLAYASAIANVGVEVEAGGTAMSLTFLKLEQISRRGGTALQTVSRVAGVDFRQAFEDDAAGATQKFIEGLGKVQAAGGDVTGILKQLGITGVREADAIRRLASSGTNLADSLGLSKTAIQSQLDIMKEYEARAATTESKVQVAWNNMTDSAITAGSVLLPVVAQASEGVASLAQAFGAMSPQGQKVAVMGAVAAAGLLLLVGGGMKAVGALVALKGNLSSLGVDLGSAGGKLNEFAAKHAGAIAGVMGLVLATQLLAAAQRAQAQSGEQVNANIKTLAKSGTDLSLVNKQISDSLRGDALNRVKDLGSAFKSLGDMARMGTGWFNDALDMTGLKTGTGVIKGELTKMDAALEDLVDTGNLQGAQDAFRKISDAAVAQGESLEFASQFFPQYRAQLEQTAAGLGNLKLSGEEYAQWMRGDIPDAVKVAAGAGGPFVANLTDQQRELAGVSGAAAAAVVSLQQYSSAAIKLSGSEIGFKSALAEANKGLKERGKGLDLNTKKGQENQTQLNQAVSSANAWLQSLKDAGASEETLARNGAKRRTDIASLAEAMGMSEEKARQFAAAMVAIPGEVAPTFSTPGLTVSKRQAKELADAVKDVPELAETKILAVGARPSKAEVDTFMESVKGIPKEKRAVLRTIAELGGVNAARDALAKIKDKGVTVTAKAAGVAAVKAAIAGIQGKTITINTRYRNQKVADGGLIHPAPAAAAAGWQASVKLAAGGTVPGQSPNPRADNIPIWATAGEFMQPNSAVDYYGLNVMEAMRRQLIPRSFFDAIGLADGGQVDASTVARGNTQQPVFAGRTVDVRVTNHYPIAEPTSVTTNKALQYVAALGL